MSTPRFELPTVPTNTTNPSVPVNNSLLRLDVLIDTVVEDMSLTAPPTTVDADIGKAWIPAATATGDWAGHEDELAVSTGADTWMFLAMPEGKKVRNLDDDADYIFEGGVWTPWGGGGGGSGDVVGPASATTDAVAVYDGTTGKLLKNGVLLSKIRTHSIIVACSDEATALTTGVAKVTFRMPYAFTLTGVRASVTTAPTGSVLTVDINEGGSTILSTKLTIDASEKTSTTAATPPAISDTTLADDAEITIDIDTVGSTIAGAGLKVTLIGYAT